MKRQWTVYSLNDPRTQEVRYVGVTLRTLHTRYAAHLSAARCGLKTHCAHWIRSLISQGLTPILSVIERGFGKSRTTAEQQWIALYRSTSSLTNLTDGGEGVPGYKASPEARAKIGAASRNRSPETRARLGAAHLGKHLSPETRAKISVSHKGQKFSPEWRAKISAALRGRPLSPETRAKDRAAHLGKRSSLETRAKQSAAQKGRTFSPETCQKLSMAQPNRKPVICVETGEFYPSILVAAKSLGLDQPSISRAIQQHGCCHGYHFRVIAEPGR